jgi:nanoRNase/pAp phosphatase (c-di-AMP/oligoRNAs hydrolase)
MTSISIDVQKITGEEIQSTGGLMSFIEKLLELVSGFRNLYIQTHNFPDHDAVASAYGLQQLFGARGIASHLIYDGEIERDSLKTMISVLGIDIRHNAEHPLSPDDRLIIVDGCKGNKNVTDLTGDEIAVIDHHEVKAPEDVLLSDIRPHFGACSTIIHSYYHDTGLQVPQPVATALMIGINMDTALLTRGVSRDDITAYAELYRLADVPLQNSILRNYIQTRDLSFYKYAIDNVSIENGIAWCHFSDGCNQNMLGILGDFFLSLIEVDFVILSARNNGVINFSLRSERENASASIIIQKVFEGIGFGGGHRDMAGGIIRNETPVNLDELRSSFIRQISGGC